MKKKISIISLLVTLTLFYCACSNKDILQSESPIVNVINEITSSAHEYFDDESNTTIGEESEDSSIKYENNASVFDYNTLPEYTNLPTVEVNNYIPFFTTEELNYAKENVFEIYSELDSLGRCGIAYANICRELMPTEARGKIGMIKPSGWHNEKYAGIDGNYIYNRCHLIGFQLAGENANEKNLITGTRYLNTEGMLPYENMIDDYVDKTSHHVLYRVTPIFIGTELVARGVLMEAQSIEDDDISFCIFVYNVQPNCDIDYVTGYTAGPEFMGTNN